MTILLQTEACDLFSLLRIPVSAVKNALSSRDVDDEQIDGTAGTERVNLNSV